MGSIDLKVAIATTDTDIQRCFPVMAHLRPHLIETEFVERIRRQEHQGYQLAYLEHESMIRAVSGFYIADALAWGRFMYVWDLVTRDGDRTQGYGKALIEWLIDRARAEQCNQFHLDSGIHRFEAHRFYMNRGLHISSYHFSMKLHSD